MKKIQYSSNHFKLKSHGLGDCQSLSQSLRKYTYISYYVPTKYHESWWPFSFEQMFHPHTNSSSAYWTIPVWWTYNIMSYRYISMECNIFLTRNWPELDIGTLIDLLVSAGIVVGLTDYWVCLSHYLNKAYPNPCRYKQIYSSTNV